MATDNVRTKITAAARFVLRKKYFGDENGAIFMSDETSFVFLNDANRVIAFPPLSMVNIFQRG
ncbi:MAG: hypothetical protein FWG14_08825 [Peptococcaceae bacterium]|nr:hypothetical protein [Peptococcaceae bacterium]